MKTYENLKCSACGYIPDQDDIDKTNYHLSECTCGQKNVCDLCLSHSFELGKYFCPVCCVNIRPLGKDRKFWLQEEYEIEDDLL